MQDTLFYCFLLLLFVLNSWYIHIYVLGYFDPIFMVFSYSNFLLLIPCFCVYFILHSLNSCVLQILPHKLLLYLYSDNKDFPLFKDAHSTWIFTNSPTCHQFILPLTCFVLFFIHLPCSVKLKISPILQGENTDTCFPRRKEKRFSMTLGILMFSKYALALSLFFKIAAAVFQEFHVLISWCFKWFASASPPCLTPVRSQHISY